MRLFIESTSLEMLEIIESGDYIPTIEQPMHQVVINLDQRPAMVVRQIPRNEWID